MADPYIRLCNHCGNRSPHELKLVHSPLQIFDYFDDDEPMLETYDWFVLVCGTCAGVTVTGGFRLERGPTGGYPSDYPVLYPLGAEILPPRHTLSEKAPIPTEVL